MDQQPSLSTSMTRSVLVLGIALALLLLTLACGSFAPRPGEMPTPTLTAVLSPTEQSSQTPTQRPSPTHSAAVKPTATPVPSPTATPDSTPTLAPPGGVSPGQQARILAPSGVNIRQEPSTQASRTGFFPAGALVVVLSGPIQADDYIWWEVDDKHGKHGWVAGVTREGELWLSSDLGEPRPVNRPVRLGDTVYVSVAANRSLTVRYEPGSNGFVARRVVGGTLLSILEGPITLDGMRWWKVRREDGLTGWSAEGDEETRWLKPIE